jgi:hypothetical protein
LYADDTSILVKDKDEVALQHKISFVMRYLEVWLNNNGLIINIDKTCAISFHPHQKIHTIKPYFTFLDSVIAYKSQLTFLGLCITETLTWNVHIHSL